MQLLLSRLALALVAATSTTAAQDVVQRLSVKFMTDADGNPPAGEYGHPAKIEWAIGETNKAFQRFGRGYGYDVVEYLYVYGYPEFYDIADDAEYALLGQMAQANPSDFHWSTTAANVYVADNSHAAKGGNPVLMRSKNLIDMIWIHELAHYNGLPHTWEDAIADTGAWPGPLQCTTQGGSVLGGDKECGCPTKVDILDDTASSNGWSQQQYDDIRFNALSYFGDPSCDPAVVFDNVRLTDGQMDVWTDTTRLSHAGEMSGFTFFVDPLHTGASNGLSTAPYKSLAGGLGAADPLGGDIVLLRAGVYAENPTIVKPVVLRAKLGAAVIGG